MSGGALNLLRTGLAELRVRETKMTRPKEYGLELAANFRRRLYA